MKNGSVIFNAMSDGNRTVVEATLFAYPHGQLSTTASSSREPGDKSDRRVGEALAMARALRKMAAKLERQANGEIKHREDIKAHRQEIAARKDPARTPGFRTWSECEYEDADFADAQAASSSAVKWRL